MPERTPNKQFSSS